MAESRRRRSVSATFLLDLLTGQLRGLDPTGAPLDVVDLGGGTGGVATALAEHGHRVTVIDPSPDALASLERRSAEAGLEGRIVGRQGDAADLVDVVGERSVDVVVCHRVLEVVESPPEALAAVAAVLRPAGALSLLAPQRRAAVLGHALAARQGVTEHRRARRWGDRQAGRRPAGARGASTTSRTRSQTTTSTERPDHVDEVGGVALPADDPALQAGLGGPPLKRRRGRRGWGR